MGEDFGTRNRGSGAGVCSLVRTQWRCRKIEKGMEETSKEGRDSGDLTTV